jgi:hypothetical protein
MKGLLISILLLFSFNNLFSQSYSYSYVDPCTGKVKSLNIPTAGNQITVNYYGAVSQFNANDFNNGNFAAWINNIASANSNKPCGEVVSLLTTNINMLVTQNIVSTVMNVTSIANMAQSMSGMADGLGNSVSNSEEGGKGRSKKNKKDRKNNNDNNGSSSSSNNNSSGQPNSTSTEQGQGSQINSNNGNGSQSTGSNGASSGNSSSANGNGNTEGSSNGNGKENPSGSGQGSGSVVNNNGSSGSADPPPSNPPSDNTPPSNPPSDNTPPSNPPSDNTPPSNPPSDNTPSDNTPSDNTPSDNTSPGTSGSNGNTTNGGSGSSAGTLESNNSGSPGSPGTTASSGSSSSGSSSESGSSSGSGNSNGSGSGGTTTSGGSGSNGEASAPPGGQDNNATTKSSKGGLSNGILNSISNSEENSGNGGNKGGSKTRTGSIIGTGDVVALKSAEDGNARNQFKFTASLTHANTKSTKVSGLLGNYTTEIKNMNVTLYKAWVVPKSQWTIIAANSSMLNFEKDFFNTTTVLASKRFKGGWKKLTVMGGLNYTMGNLGDTKFNNLSAVGGGFYSYNIGKSKKLSGSILCLAVYSPFTQFFEGQWWESGTLLVPFNSWDYSITKSISGVYQVNQNMLNYQILTGGKMML